VLDGIETSLALPEVQYVALHRGERKSALISSLVLLAQESCDFSQFFRRNWPMGSPAQRRDPMPTCFDRAAPPALDKRTLRNPIGIETSLWKSPHWINCAF
jgi:hypothetical protein